MVRIWTKLIKNDKLTDNYMYELNENFEIDKFEEYIREICYSLDIPNPIILTKHIKNFLLFNSSFFTKDDFVEKIHFEKMIIENANLE